MNAAWELCRPPEHRFRHYRHKGAWSVGPKGAKRRLVSVTQVLDAADDRLQQWMLGQAFIAGERDGCAPGLRERAYTAGHGPEAIRDKAAALGTISHEALEALATGTWRGAKVEAEKRAAAQCYELLAAHGDAPGPPFPLLQAADLWPRFVGLEQFFADHAPRTEQAETAVGSVKHAFAGTFDWFGGLSGFRGLCLLDAKNTNMLSWRHPVQLGGYEIARREDGMRASQHQLILRLTQYGTYQLVSVAELGGYAHMRNVFLAQLRVFRGERQIDRALDKLKNEEVAG